jgi:hypothetical protein
MTCHRIQPINWIFNMNNRMGDISPGGTAYSSGAPKFTLCFCGFHVVQSSVFCAVFCWLYCLPFCPLSLLVIVFSVLRFFNLQLLITTLVWKKIIYSNFYWQWKVYILLTAVVNTCSYSNNTSMTSFNLKCKYLFYNGHRSSC